MKQRELIKNFKENNKDLSNVNFKKELINFKKKLKKEAEQDSYERWLTEKSKKKNQRAFWNFYLKPPKIYLSRLEKEVSFLTFILMNKMKYGAYNKVTNAVVSLLPIYKYLFLVNQGKEDWLNKDLLFNTVLGLTYFENILEYIIGEKNEQDIYKFIPEINEVDLLQQAMGAAIARDKINVSNTNFFTGKIFIYIEVKQLIKGNVIDALKIIKENKIKNIVFVLSATDNDLLFELEKAKKELKEVDIKIWEPDRKYVNYINLMKKIKKTKKPQAIITLANEAVGTHWEKKTIKSSYPLKGDIDRIQRDFQIDNLSLLNINTEAISNFKLHIRKRIIDIWDDWNEINKFKDDKFNKRIFKDNWNKLNKNSLLTKFKKGKVRSLEIANNKIIETIKARNKNLFIGEYNQLLSVNLALGMSLYKQRSIIKIKINNSEKVIDRLREAERLDVGIVVIIEYNRQRIDNLDFEKIINAYQNSFKNVMNVANFDELVTAWLVAQKNTKKVSIILVDTAPLIKINLSDQKKIGSLENGAYIIKKRKQIGKPIDYIFYGSGTIINDIVSLALEAETLEKLNIQVVSIPWENKMYDNPKNKKILLSNVKKVEFKSTGIGKRIKVKKIKSKLIEIDIPSTIWRSSNKKEVIRNVIIK